MSHPGHFENSHQQWIIDSLEVRIQKVSSTMKRILAVVASVALVSAGCFKSSSTVTTPSNSSSALGGTWVTVTSVPGSFGAQTCTNFTWAVTSFTGATGSGTFGATCFGNMQIA